MNREDVTRLKNAIQSLTEAEWNAIIHEHTIEDRYSRHSTTSCPPGTRALCDFKSALESAHEKFDGLE